MWETILGGGIAVAGAALTQYFQGKRERDRWKRQASYDERRKAYVAFIDSYRSYQKATATWEQRAAGSSQPVAPPSIYDDDALDPLRDLLTPIQIYGSKDAIEHARAAIPAMWAYMQSDGDYDVAVRVNDALKRLIGEVRRDLDIPDPEPSEGEQWSST